jgi:hypothetical protein
VYDLSRSFALCKTNGRQAAIYTESLLSDTSADFTYHIEGDLVSKGIKSYAFKIISDTTLAQHNVFMIDTSLFYVFTKRDELPLIALKDIDYVILTNNPFLNIETASEIFPQAKYILSPSNSYKSLNYWKKYFDEKNIGYYDLKNNGYVLLAK